MGLFKKRSWSTYSNPPPAVPNPDPKNFRINRQAVVGGVLVLEVIYPDCTNYEGRKILVYTGVTMVDLLKQGSIDPHFCNNPTCHSPIARFEPTETGWAFALHVAEAIRELK